MCGCDAGCYAVINKCKTAFVKVHRKAAAYMGDLRCRYGVQLAHAVGDG